MYYHLQLANIIKQPVTRMLDTLKEWKAKESGTDFALKAVIVRPPDALAA